MSLDVTLLIRYCTLIACGISGRMGCVMGPREGASLIIVVGALSALLLVVTIGLFKYIVIVQDMMVMRERVYHHRIITHGILSYGVAWYARHGSLLEDNRQYTKLIRAWPHAKDNMSASLVFHKNADRILITAALFCEQAQVCCLTKKIRSTI
jgi:hypothetical protein